MNITISIRAKFQPKLKLLLFWTKFSQKGYFRLKTEKKIINKHYHFFLLIAISPGTKFQLKLTILNFRTNFAKYAVGIFGIYQTIFAALALQTNIVTEI